MAAPEGYEAARRDAAWREFPLARLLFSGPDRLKFLHGLLTSDVLNLPPGRGRHSCVLTPKGKLVADFALYNRGPDVLGLVWPALQPALVAALSKTIILSETKLEDAAGRFGSVYLTGPAAGRILENLFGADPGLGPYACAELNWKGIPVQVASFPLYDRRGAVVLAPPADTAAGFTAALVEAGRPFGLAPLSSLAFEALRLESQSPLCGVDTDADALPLEFDMEDAISYDKGCYLGQETTARVKNFGHVNRKLVGLRLAEPPIPGSEVHAGGESVGRVTSAARSPLLGACVALAVVRAAKAAHGTRLQVLSEGRTWDADIIGPSV